MIVNLLHRVSPRRNLWDGYALPADTPLATARLANKVKADAVAFPYVSNDVVYAAAEALGLSINYSLEAVRVKNGYDVARLVETVAARAR